MEDYMYTISEASHILGVSEATIRNWIKTGIFSVNIQKSDIDSVLNQIKNDSLLKLKSRRNRSKSFSSFLSKNYINDKELLKTARDIVKLANEIDISEDEIKIVILSYFKKAYSTIPAPKNEATFSSILDSFMPKNSTFLNEKMSKITSFPLPNIIGIDFLGLLYTSLLTVSKKSKNGSYYTPSNIVKEMIENLNEKSDTLIGKDFWDPCCGTGNFLIYLNQFGVPISHLYGSDLDETSVLICRMNMFLINPNIDYKILCTHFDCRNSLNTFNRQVDVILGNPPWGADVENCSFLESCYETYSTTIDSFELFLEQSLKSVKNNGISYLILPESLLSVSSHMAVRKFICQHSKLIMANLWGTVFDHVQTKAVSLMLKKESKLNFFGNAQVISSQKNYFISPSRQFNISNWNVETTDKENEILNKILKINAAYLKGNADFALGIVTGNNAKYIKNNNDNNNSYGVLRGSDLHSYVYDVPKIFLDFEPENFQQVAPSCYYFAQEKLLYKFISNSLVFSYDNKKTLSLNSANIVIPHFKNLSLKYVLAVLNSSVANFFWKMEFHSLKVLRNQIESIPIPFACEEKQIEIVDHVNNILNGISKNDEIKKIDRLILDLYGLNSDDGIQIKLSLEL